MPQPAKKNYTIKVVDKKNKQILKESAHGYAQMRAERGALKRGKLSKTWYRVEIKEDASGAKSVPIESHPTHKLELVVRKNEKLSEEKNQTYYSLYEKGKKQPYNGSFWSKKASANQSAHDIMDAHNHNYRQHAIA